jgi:tetratricopeptide (TPR) repeat protein
LNALSAPLLQAGMNAMKARRLQEAIGAFQQAAKVDPESSEAWSYLGAAYSQAADYESARQAFGRAIQLKPQSAKCWFNLGVAHQMAGDAESARTCFQSALDRDPSYAAAHDALIKLTPKTMTMADLASPGGAVRLPGAHTVESHESGPIGAKPALTAQEMARLSTPQGQFHMMGAQATDAAAAPPAPERPSTRADFHVGLIPDEGDVGQAEGHRTMAVRVKVTGPYLREPEIKTRAAQAIRSMSARFAPGTYHAQVDAIDEQHQTADISVAGQLGSPEEMQVLEAELRRWFGEA